jgi:hypothetical protein
VSSGDGDGLRPAGRGVHAVGAAGLLLLVSGLVVALMTSTGMPAVYVDSPIPRCPGGLACGELPWTLPLSAGRLAGVLVAVVGGLLLAGVGGWSLRRAGGAGQETAELSAFSAAVGVVLVVAGVIVFAGASRSSPEFGWTSYAPLEPGVQRGFRGHLGSVPADGWTVLWTGGHLTGALLVVLGLLLLAAVGGWLLGSTSARQASRPVG